MGGTHVIVVMGVAGAGKTTVGRELARAIGWEFHDADDYHPAENIAKIHGGQPLTDEDREPWLASLRAMIAKAIREGRHVVLACSALKQSYRDSLSPAGMPEGAVRFVYLDVPVAELQQRLAHRHHFAPPAILPSQLATLEKPRDAIWIDGRRAVPDEVRDIREALAL